MRTLSVFATIRLLELASMDAITFSNADFLETVAPVVEGVLFSRYDTID